jgi:hypothetical protein
VSKPKAVICMPTQGEVFAATMTDVFKYALDRAIAVEREECAMAADRVIDQSAENGLVSCTAKAIASLIRER